MCLNCFVSTSSSHAVWVNIFYFLSYLLVWMILIWLYPRSLKKWQKVDNEDTFLLKERNRVSDAHSLVTLIGRKKILKNLTINICVSL